MKPLSKRIYVLSTHLHGNARQRYLDCAGETVGTLVLTRDKAYAKVFKGAAEANDAAITIWTRYCCALYVKEVPCENMSIILPDESVRA